MSHIPDPDFDSVHASRGDRWWAIISLSVLAIIGTWGGIICYQLIKIAPPPAAAVDHGPLPATVRAKAMAILNADLKDAKLEERWEGQDRDFFVMGTPKPEFAMPFIEAFHADVANQLLPLLRPYGETVSFQIYNFDFAPVRMRPLLKASPSPVKD